MREARLVTVHTHDPVHHCHVQRSKTRLVGREEAQRRTSERGRVEQHVLRRGRKSIESAAEKLAEALWHMDVRLPRVPLRSARELNGEERIATGGALDRGEPRAWQLATDCVAQQPVDR